MLGVTNPKAHLQFQTVSAEFSEEHQRRRLVQNARVFRCSGEHDVFHLLQFTVVGNGDLNRQPVFARGVRQVLHRRIDQGFIRHNRFGAVERLQHRVARVDMRHRATVFVNGNDVADANRAIQQNDEAGQIVACNPLQA